VVGLGCGRWGVGCGVWGLGFEIIIIIRIMIMIMIMRIMMIIIITMIVGERFGNKFVEISLGCSLILLDMTYSFD